MKQSPGDLSDLSGLGALTAHHSRLLILKKENSRIWQLFYDNLFFPPRFPQSIAMYEAKERQKFISDAQYLREMQHKMDNEYQVGRCDPFPAPGSLGEAGDEAPWSSTASHTPLTLFHRLA